MKNLNFISVLFSLLCLIFISCDNKKMETKAYSEIGDSLKVESPCCKNNRNSFLLLENDSIEISSPLVVISKDSLKMVEEMILIEGGEFMMGSSSKEFALRREFPRHKVKVKSFLMDVHEVTNKQFSKFVEENGITKMIEVETGISDFENIEILSGLAEKDRVISGPYIAISQKLKDGSIIKVNKVNGKGVNESGSNGDDGVSVSVRIGN